MDVHPTKNVSIGIDPYPYDVTIGYQSLSAQLQERHGHTVPQIHLGLFLVSGQPPKRTKGPTWETYKTSKDSLPKTYMFSLSENSVRPNFMVYQFIIFNIRMAHIHFTSQNC
jgi:hypothetical protein